MCGRFTRKYTWAEIHRLYRLTTPDSNFEPRYSICPKNDIDTVLPAFERQGLVPMRWGLVPSWWSKPLKEMKSATFNARAETDRHQDQPAAAPCPAEQPSHALGLSPRQVARRESSQQGYQNYLFRATTHQRSLQGQTRATICQRAQAGFSSATPSSTAGFWPCCI